jgi:mannosylglucosylglycerate synthase
MNITILHYACYPIVGGVESIITTHARLFEEAGHSVFLVAGRGDPAGVGLAGKIIPEIDSRHPELLEVQRSLLHEDGGAEAAFDDWVDHLCSLLTEALAEADVVIVHNAFTLHKNLALTAALTRLAREIPDKKWIAWCHDLAWNNPLYRHEVLPRWPWTLLRERLQNVTYVAISEQRRQEMTRLFGMALGDIKLIPNGIDPVAFIPTSPQLEEVRHRLRWSERDWVFLAPVRVTRRKNLELAVDIVASIRDLGHDPLLVVTGPPGPHGTHSDVYLRELLARREALNASDTVAFLAVEEFDVTDALMVELYWWSDALLLTSDQEGFGLPLIEAGLLRIPIFCSNIPVLQEVGGEHPYYFSLDAPPDEIAESIVTTLERPGLPAMRRKVLSAHSWDSLFRSKILPLVE